MGYNAVAAV